MGQRVREQPSHPPDAVHQDLFQRAAEPEVEVVEPVAEEPAAEVEMQNSVEMDNASEVADDAAEAEPTEQE